MGRFGRFEVNRETRDDGNISLDGNQGHIDAELLEELGKVGFDDAEFEFRQENIEIKLDENGNPVIPDGWTFLTHGSSLDRWDTSLLGNDFVVGNGKVNEQEVKWRPLCCEERSTAKFNYDRKGSNTAKTYGGKQQSFEIRVLLYKNPRLADGKVVRDKLSPDEIKDVLKYYMYQDGRHPAVPVGTKLTFIKSGTFDEITNTSGNNILWYIPEQYLQQYLDDVQQIQNKDIDESVITENNENSQENEEHNIPEITNSDVEQELNEYYTDDTPVSYIKAYLSEKLSLIYEDRLKSAGVDKNLMSYIDIFLEEQHLEHFKGANTYKEMVAEFEAMIADLELTQQKEIEINSFRDPIIETNDSENPILEESEEPFGQMLENEGFDLNCVQGIKSTIKNVDPRKLVSMDSALRTIGRTSIGGRKDGNKQSVR